MKHTLTVAQLLLINLIVCVHFNSSNAQVEQIADINLGSGSSSPKYLTSFQNSLIFIASDGIHEDVLWRYSQSGVELIADITPEHENVTRWHKTVFNDEFIFAARDSIHGVELWRYDGENTEMIIDIRVEDDSSSFPSMFVEYQGDLYFVANSSFNFKRLWKYNGTTCIPVTDLGLNVSTPEMKVVNDLLFFGASTTATGPELFKWDGQAAEMVADLGAASIGSIPRSLVQFNNQLYFIASMNGPSLCKSDGNTIEILYTFDGTGGGSIGRLMPMEGTLIFSAYKNNFGYELWQHDPIASTTVMIHDIAEGNVWSYPSFFEYFNGRLFFTASDNLGPELYNFELWEYKQGAIQQYDLNLFGSTAAHEKLSIDSLLLFNGVHPELGAELYTYDGIEFNTYDIYPGATPSAPTGLTIHKNAVYFSANDGVSGHELWRFGPALEAKITSIQPILYPNPSTLEYVTLNYGEWLNCEVQLFDNFGRIVNEWNQGSSESQLIDLSAYRGGMYFVRLKNAENQIVLKLNAL